MVKNVAGHAVHRLLVGSRGALGVLLEASLKLLPQPPARVAMLWAADAGNLANTERWRDWPRREPAALTVLGRAVAALNPVMASDAPYAVVAGFEDHAAWVEDCATFARDSLGTPRVKVQDASVPPLWQQLADAEEMPGVRLTFTTAANTPDAIAFLHGTAGRRAIDIPCRMRPAALVADRRRGRGARDRARRPWLRTHRGAWAGAYQQYDEPRHHAPAQAIARRA